MTDEKCYRMLRKTPADEKVTTIIFIIKNASSFLNLFYFWEKIFMKFVLERKYMR